ncbi:Uncharacterized protein TPAR_01750, partial [Tolypocladium paradoxum]
PKLVAPPAALGRSIDRRSVFPLSLPFPHHVSSFPGPLLLAHSRLVACRVIFSTSAEATVDAPLPSSTAKRFTMKAACLLVAALATSPALTVAGAPVGPTGPCPAAKVDAILKGEMDPSECCSYGICKGDVVVSVGD